MLLYVIMFPSNHVQNQSVLSLRMINTAELVYTTRAATMIRLLLDEYGELPDFSKEDFIQYHKEHIVYDTLI